MLFLRLSVPWHRVDLAEQGSAVGLGAQNPTPMAGNGIPMLPELWQFRAVPTAWGACSISAAF